MGFWDTMAGAGEAVDPARQWLETIYKIRKQGVDEDEVKKEQTLRQILGTEGALKDAAYQGIKAGRGKGGTIDTSPYQSRRDEAQRQAAGKFFQKDVMESAGAEPFDWEKTPAEAGPEASQIGAAAPYKPPTVPAAPPDVQPDVIRPAESRAKILREAQSVSIDPAEEAAVVSKINWIRQNYPPAKAEALVNMLWNGYMRKRQAKQEGQMAEAGGHVYDTMHPETTTDTLAERRIAQTTEKEAEDRASHERQTRMSSGVGYQRNAMDEAQRKAAEDAQNEMRAKYAEKLDSLQKMRDIVAALPAGEGMAGIPSLAELDATIAQVKREGIAYAAPGLPVKPEAAMAGWQRGAVESQKTEARAAGKTGAGAAKPPDLKTSAKILQDQIDKLGFVTTPEDKQKKADLESQLRAVTEKKLEQEGVEWEPGVVKKEEKKPSEPGIFSRGVDKVTGLFSSPPAAPKPPAPARGTPEAKQRVQLAMKKYHTDEATATRNLLAAGLIQ